MITKLKIREDLTPEKNKKVGVLSSMSNTLFEPKDIPKDLTECIEFHSHLCQGIVIGYMAAKIGMEKMKWRRAKKLSG